MDNPDGVDLSMIAPPFAFNRKRRESHVNIDGDVILYAVGYACQSKNEDGTIEVEPLSHCLSSVKRMIKNIVIGSKADSYTVLLTGKGNFRESVATYQPYKGNRAESSKPIRYPVIKEYLVMEHEAEVIEGEEADDQLSIRAVRYGDIIATIDKDLDNTSGWHYNWNKDELYMVTPDEANTNFALQLLVGDSTDNIPGLKRLTGAVASAKKKSSVAELDGDYLAQMRQVVSIYTDALDGDGETAIKMVNEIGQLLWMRRVENETWSLPEGI